MTCLLTLAWNQSRGGMLKNDPQPYCAANGIDPEIFYPVTVEQYDGTAYEHYNESDKNAAITFCKQCPLREACLWEEYYIHLPIDDIHGIRGGVTARKRKNLYAEANAGLRPASGYPED